MIAGVALIALTMGTGQAAETPATGGGAEAKAAPKQTDKELTDHEGNTLTLTLDDAGKVAKTSAKNKQGKVLDVVEHKMQDLSVCIARKAKKPLCQPLQSMSDAASFRFGTATCTCQVYSGYLYCYGDTCH
jgi:hypothetical protein